MRILALLALVMLAGTIAMSGSEWTKAAKGLCLVLMLMALIILIMDLATMVFGAKKPSGRADSKKDDAPGP